MVFRQIDTAATAADQPLSSPLLSHLRDCITQTRTDRLRACGVSWDARNPPLLSGVASDEEEGERGVLLLLWRPSRPGITELTLELHAYNPSALEVYLSAAALRVGDLFQPGGVLPIAAEQTLAGGATDTLSFEVNLTGQADDLVVVVLMARSEFGATEVLWIDGGGITGDASGLANATEAPMHLRFEAGAEWDGSAALSNGITPYRLIFGLADDGLGAFDPSAFDPDDPRLQDTLAFALPRAQHLIGTRTGPGSVVGAIGYIYPGISASYSLSGLDAVARQPMGYALLRGLHLRETAAGGLDAGANAYAPGVAASAARVGLLTQEAEDLYTLHEGPLALGSNASPLADGESLSSRVHLAQDAAYVGTGGSWATLGRWMVGGPRGAARAAGDSSSTVRNVYTLDALLSWAVARADWQQGQGVVELRLGLTDGDGSSNRVDGAARRILMRTAPYSEGQNGSVITSSPLAAQGYLLGLRRANGLARHNLRDMWPERLVPRLGAYLVDLSIGDDGDTSSTAPRLLTLEARIDPDPPYSGGSSRAGAMVIHLLGALVDVARSNVPQLLGA